MSMRARGFAPPYVLKHTARSMKAPMKAPKLARWAPAAMLLAATAGSWPVLAAGTAAGDWTTYRNARHGYSIAYPTSRFPDEPANESEDGRLVVSKDGATRLLVGAFENAEGTSLKDYRAYLIEKNYQGAEIDYAPMRDRWFVLSGTREGTMFYERVSFTCGGKLINSWAILYPAGERRTWDPVLERIARTYTPGAGRDGQCQ